MAKDNAKPAKEEVKEEVQEAPVKEKKSKDPVVGVSNQGVTQYAPGQHPKARQIADKQNPPTEE